MFPFADFDVKVPSEPGTNSFTIQLENKSIAATSFKWFFGDGSAVTGNVSSYSYPKPGSYLVTLQAYDANGSWSERAVEIKIAAAPVVAGIVSFRIVEETATKIVADVNYFYTGSQGDSNIFLSMRMATDGTVSPYYGHSAGAVTKGTNNTTRCSLLILNKAPKDYKTNQLDFGFYIGGKDYIHREFKPYNKIWNQPAANIIEDCIPFNPDNVTAVPYGNQGQYRILDGNMAMLVCPNKAEAVRIVEIIKYYRLNKQCFVGRPDPSFTYWLSGANAPTGALSGEDCISFNPANIEVKQIGGRWKIVEGSHWMFDFAENETEARNTFAIIKKYNFNKTCFVGRPDPSMAYLKK